MVITGGISVWIQIRIKRVISLRQIVFSATQYSDIILQPPNHDSPDAQIIPPAGSLCCACLTHQCPAHSAGQKRRSAPVHGGHPPPALRYQSAGTCSPQAAAAGFEPRSRIKVSDSSLPSSAFILVFSTSSPCWIIPILRHSISASSR